MFRKQLIGITILLGLFSVSCFPDKGNYDYVDKEIIQIDSINEYYNVEQFKTKLNIHPKVSSNIPNAQFEYAYWVYDKNVSQQVPDTLQVGEKDLNNYLITLESKIYKLIFYVKNKITGVSAYKESELNVTTSTNMGWYVFKSLNGKCDLDFYNKEGESVENILLTTSGRQLEGDKAERLTVGTNYADPEKLDPNTNLFQKTTVLFPVSDQDAKAVDLSTGKIINDFPQMFLDEPSGPYAPGMAFYSVTAQFILNQGKVYYYWPYTSALSKFAVELARNASFDPYRLSKYVMLGTPNSIGFDEMSTSFVGIPAGNSTVLMTLLDAKGSKLSANYNSMDLLWAGSKGLYDAVHYAVVQDKNDKNRKLILYLTYVGNSLDIQYDSLSIDDPAFNSCLFTMNHASPKILYFVTDREVYARTVAAIPGVNSCLKLNIPDGDITFIKHMPYSVYGKPEESFDYLFLGIVKSDMYFVCGWELDSSGQPQSAEPSIRFSGTGCPGDVMYVFPGIQPTTFIPSY